MGVNSGECGDVTPSTDKLEQFAGQLYPFAGQ